MSPVRTAALSALTIGALTIPATPAASAAPATCQGQPTTITGDGGTVTGTDGDDVISTTGVVTVDALGGHDLVCAQDGIVFAGAGNDSVLRTTSPLCCTLLQVDLGPGNDTLEAPAGDTWVTGDSAGKDAITTGSGDNRVTSGVDGEPNLDVISLGSGNDSLELRLPDGSDVLATGSSANYLTTVGSDTVSGDWAFDLDEAITRDGEHLASISGFYGHYFDFGPAAHVTVTGSDSREDVGLGEGRFDIDLRGGDDRLTFDTSQSTRIESLDGGTGQDELLLAGRKRIKVHFGVGTARVDDDAPFALAHFEHTLVSAEFARVVGSKRADRITAQGCDVKVNGAGGADVVKHIVGEDYSCKERVVLKGGAGKDRLVGSRKQARLEGGGGNDRLKGGRNGDVLIGGPGRDKADGGGSDNDRCAAEVEKRCER